MHINIYIYVYIYKYIYTNTNKLYIYKLKEFAQYILPNRTTCASKMYKDCFDFEMMYRICTEVVAPSCTFFETNQFKVHLIVEIRKFNQKMKKQETIKKYLGPCCFI